MLALLHCKSFPATTPELVTDVEDNAPEVAEPHVMEFVPALKAPVVVMAPELSAPTVAELVPQLNVPPMFRFLAIPIPPAVTTDPVPVLELSVSSTAFSECRILVAIDSCVRVDQHTYNHNFLENFSAIKCSKILSPLYSNTAMLVCGIDPGVRDLGLCVLRVDLSVKPVSFDVLEWRVVNPKPEKQSSGWDGTVDVAVAGLVAFMKQWMSTSSCLASADKENVVFFIERQFMNQRLIAISHAIQTFLLTTGFGKVRFVHSMSRFNVVGHYGWQADTEATSGDVKKRSLYVARKLLTTNKCAGEIAKIDKAPSHHKDDYSDALLLAASGAVYLKDDIKMPHQR